MRIGLHHLKNSRSQRIIWLFEELGIEYYLLDSEFMPSQEADPLIDPIKYPTVEFYNENADTPSSFFLPETSAIFEYFCSVTKWSVKPHRGGEEVNTNNITPKPDSQLESTSFYYWKNYADATLMPLLTLKQTFKQITLRTPFIFKPFTFLIQHTFNKMYLNNELVKELKKINNHLANRLYFCGDVFTFVDILMWFPIKALLHSIPDTAPNHHYIHTYLINIESREESLNALKRGRFDPLEFKQYWS